MNENTTPTDAATMVVERIQEIVARAKGRDERIAVVHAKVMEANPLADQMRVLDHVAESAVREAEALDQDFLTADRAASELARALEREADSHTRLPSEVQAVVGSKSETMTTTLLAKLLDETTAARAEASLRQMRPTAWLDWYRGTSDEADPSRIREAEAMVLDRGFRPVVDDPDEALAVDALVRVMRERRRGRIPAHVTEARTALEHATRQLRTWRYTLQGLPRVDRSLVQDVVRRARVAR